MGRYQSLLACTFGWSNYCTRHSYPTEIVPTECLFLPDGSEDVVGVLDAEMTDQVIRPLDFGALMDIIGTTTTAAEVSTSPTTPRNSEQLLQGGGCVTHNGPVEPIITSLVSLITPSAPSLESLTPSSMNTPVTAAVSSNPTMMGDASSTVADVEAAGSVSSSMMEPAQQ